MENNVLLCEQLKKLASEMKSKIIEGAKSLSEDERKKLAGALAELDLKGKQDATINDIKEIIDTLK